MRVTPIPADEKDDALDATHRIAIHFSHLEEAGVEKRESNPNCARCGNESVTHGVGVHVRRAVVA